MAFNRDFLARLGSQANAPAFWVYSSADDNAAAIKGANYFNAAAKELGVGDFLVFRDSAGVSTISYVTSNDGTTVAIAAGNVIAAA
jgi:hypothetical protein